MSMQQCVVDLTVASELATIHGRFDRGFGWIREQWHVGCLIRFLQYKQLIQCVSTNFSPCTTMSSCLYLAGIYLRCGSFHVLIFNMLLIPIPQMWEEQPGFC